MVKKNNKQIKRESDAFRSGDILSRAALNYK